MTSEWPTVSIITCVFNGANYISRLFDSVISMGYPCIEHIVIDDGSTDSTAEIIGQYIALYENRPDAHLQLKHFRCNHQGLGAATNEGLRHVSGELWTWINCDDWYEKGAFFEPVRILLKSPHFDYIQLNGTDRYSDSRMDAPIIKKGSKMAFSQKEKLFIQHASCDPSFRYLLYVCKTASYQSICNPMQIYPSAYTQDEQFITQIFGLLHGAFSKQPAWNFLHRSDSYFQKVSASLAKDYMTIWDASVDMLSVPEEDKHALKRVYRDCFAVDELKRAARAGHFRQCAHKMVSIVQARKSIPLKFKRHLNHRLLPYVLYALIGRKQ